MTILGVIFCTGAVKGWIDNLMKPQIRRPLTGFHYTK